MQRKKNSILFFLLLGIIFLAGCGSNESQTEEKPKVINNVFLMYEEKSLNESDQSIGDLYMISDGKEKEKIASNVLDGNYDYINNLDKVLFLDEDRSLYEFEKGKEKNKLAEDVTYFNGNYEDGLVTYQNEDGDLYIIKDENGEEKIASSVMQYELIGNFIYYIDDDYDFSKYNIKDRQETEIDSDVYYFTSLSSKDEVAYLNEDLALFYKSGNDETIKITSDEVSGESIKKIGSKLVYYNIEDEDSTDLYVAPIKEAGTSTKVAGDVRTYKYEDGYFYYLNEDDNLFKKKETDEESTKLVSDASNFKIKNGTLYFTNEDNDLYKLSRENKKEKIASSTTDYDVSPKGDVVYTTDNKDLFVNSKKIASGIENFKHYYGNVAFAGEDDKLYLMENMDEKIVVVDDLNQYSSASYQNKVIFENTLSFRDLAGVWKAEDGESSFYIDIDKDGLFTYLLDGETEQFEVGYSSYSSLNVYSDVSDITFYRDDKNELTMNMDGMDIPLVKSSKDESKKYYEEQVLQEEKVIIENMMGNYITDFESAVNYGNEFYIEDYLDPSSPMYDQQREYVVSTYENNIMEELVDYKIDSVERTEEGLYMVKTTEIFTIYNGVEDFEGSTNTYKNTYTVKKVDGEFLITNIKASQTDTASDADTL